MAKLEAAIASRRREEEEAMLKRGQEKEAAVRSQHKEKVNITPIALKVARFSVSFFVISQYSSHAL